MSHAKILSNLDIDDDQSLNFNLSYSVLAGDSRERISEINDNSVDLIITSPPYGAIKNYSKNNKQIGWAQSYSDYHESLLAVFRECVRILKPGCRMVINIGDEFVSTTKNKPYHVIPHGSQIISNLINEFPDTLMYNGTIHWDKVTTSNTSGGGKIMGSVYHPRNGHFFVNYEHIIVFKKFGKSKSPSKIIKELSKFSLEERRIWFSDTWNIKPERQNEHIAMFPIELPERLIKMYSFVGDIVFDPFLGSGTTMAAAAKNQRSGLGIELGFTSNSSWKSIIKDKVNKFNSDEASIKFH